MTLHRPTLRLAIWLTAALLPTTTLAADEAEVLVTASRMAETVDETLAPVTVITRADIERQQAQSVQELLRSVPGLSIANNGGPGKTTSFFLRGTESDHVLVLIDGIKVGSATLGSTAFQDLPVAQIERIEIVRGPRSSLYGSEAIGGVIQIFTRKGNGPTHPFFSVGAGRYRTYEVTVGAAGGSERSRFNVSADATDTQGFNSCKGSLTSACYTIEPDKDGYNNRSLAFSGGHRFDNGVETDVHLLRTKGHTEFDGGYQNQADSVQQVMGASLRYTPNETWQTQLTAGRSKDESENFLNGAFASRYATTRDALSWQNDITLTETQLLTLGVDYQNDEVDSSVIYATTSRDNTGVFAQFQGDFGNHSIQLSTRRDDNEQFGGHSTGGASWGYTLNNGLRITAAYGTAFKAPTFNELYFPYYGNPTLRPEESRSAELGLSAKTGAGRWTLNLFETRVDKLIAYDASLMAPNNIDEALIRGVEATLHHRLNDWLLNTQLTLLDPQNRSSGAYFGNVLPRRARQTLSVSTDRSMGQYDLGMTLTAAGERYDDLANAVKLAGYATVDLRAEYRFNKDWRLQAKIENLFDKDYETAALYNQPGRGLYLTLRYAP